MCEQPPEQPDGTEQPEDSHGLAKEPFPWHLGACDAHCHPTDTMASVSSIPRMRSRALTIMATRSQDQHLVSKVAQVNSSYSPYLGVNGNSELLSQNQDTCTVIPSFGWHPWFSYQLDDDTKSPSIANATSCPQESTLDYKKKHYTAVLEPSPSDPDFIASLPTPESLTAFIESTRSFLRSHPTAVIGEIGLDKVFRLPVQWDAPANASRDEGLTPGGREGRMLSPHRVRMTHQQAVMKAQLGLAGEMERPVSIHGVQAHGVLHDTVAGCWKGYELEVISKRRQKLAAKGAEPDSDSESEEGKDTPGETTSKDKPLTPPPFPPRICLHSYSGSVQTMRQWLHPSYPSTIYFSFSIAVNTSTESSRSKLRDLLATVPDDRVLVESDLHVAGDSMDLALEDMYRLVCEVKGWGLEEGVLRIRRNFDEYIFGKQKMKKWIKGKKQQEEELVTKC